MLCFQLYGSTHIDFDISESQLLQLQILHVHLPVLSAMVQLLTRALTKNSAQESTVAARNFGAVLPCETRNTHGQFKIDWEQTRTISRLLGIGSQINFTFKNSTADTTSTEASKAK